MKSITRHVNILDYVEHLFIFALTSLVCVAVGITSSVVGIKICAITAAMKKCKSIVKKNKKKYDKIVFLGKDKLNTIVVLISKALINHILVMTNFFQ